MRPPQVSGSVRLTEIIPTGRALGTHHSQRRGQRNDLLGLKAVPRFLWVVTCGRALTCWSRAAAPGLLSRWQWWGGGNFLATASERAAKVAIAARAAAGRPAAGGT